MVKLDKFKGIKAEINFMPIIDEYANKCVEILRNNSPVGVRRNRKYCEGWVADPTGKMHRDIGTRVWNATNYQLTHLLEHGHLIVNKKGGVGWAAPKPHIFKAFNEVKRPFINAMSRAEINVQVKE